MTEEENQREEGKEEAVEEEEEQEEEEVEEFEKEEEAIPESPILNSGDAIEVTKGEYTGKTAKVISQYSNSISIELDEKDVDGSKPRTVLRHTEYKII
ncbi:DUF2187 family protein [Salisediminibacterium halotolerans]|uniref:Myotubularin-related protein 1/2 n=1 Tax=Salisediminibacterium halotolerans TaxID=517425 RepID=A0A1H9RTL9_9BACI|nr:DUF2187 family protein [Salisediminibacterium haloalkalitolerans]SER75473.1 myotubularin-related protein 1/2 [Salisediminibacterium haloalkalitolerans]